MKTFEDLVDFLLEHDCRIFVKQYETRITASIRCRGKDIAYVGYSGDTSFFTFGSTTRKLLYKNILNFTLDVTLVVKGVTVKVPRLEIS